MNQKINILLVDDEPRNLDVLDSVLRDDDYNLVRVPSAERALLELLKGEFAAIVLDVQMPDMSGLELATVIKQRKRTQHIPIIFLTAYYQEDKDVLDGYETGAVDYLTKPINPQILRSKIAVFVDLFRKTRALSETNLALEQEVTRRQSAEEALRQANNELEKRVEARTADLVRVNAELVEQEKQVGMARDRALAASRAKDEFVARLSHELRTPLNPVLLIASDAASNPALPTDVRADFSKIAENAALEARLIDDLLDLTRITQGKLLLDLRPFDFDGAIHDVLAMVRAEIEQKRLQLRLELRPKGRLVLGDDVRVRQIVWNVLKNAVKFTPPGGTIIVQTTTLDDGNLLLLVTDTGIGMTDEEIAKIFETFWQGEHATSGGGHSFGGLGLGLSISRMLAELHGGSISATSPGKEKGSTFRVELPLTPAPEPAATVDTDELPPGEIPTESAKRRRILVVEDHAPTAGALALLLGRRNFEVTIAGSLLEARRRLVGDKFDLLISDIGLPDGNGCALMMEVRAQTDLIGIALTGYGMEADVERCKAAGFAIHLTKPVRAQELDKALGTVWAATAPNALSQA